jgi:DNA repair exonuclease SbcCD ATPase subunit
MNEITEQMGNVMKELQKLINLTQQEEAVLTPDADTIAGVNEGVPEQVCFGTVPHAPETTVTITPDMDSRYPWWTNVARLDGELRELRERTTRLAAVADELVRDKAHSNQYTSNSIDERLKDAVDYYSRAEGYVKDVNERLICVTRDVKNLDSKFEALEEKYLANTQRLDAVMENLLRDHQRLSLSLISLDKKIKDNKDDLNEYHTSVAQPAIDRLGKDVTFLDTRVGDLESGSFNAKVAEKYCRDFAEKLENPPVDGIHI